MQKTSSRILHSQLSLTAEAWREIKKSPVPADRWLGNFFHKNRKKVGSRDRKFVSECVYSLFRHKTYFESWLKKCNPRDEDYFMGLLAAAFEGFLTKSEFGEKLSGPMSGQLYNALKKGEMIQVGEFASPAERLSKSYSFPEWLVSRWVKSFGEKKCESLLRAFCERPPLVVRTNTLKIFRGQLVKLFEKEGHVVEPTPYSPVGIVFSERANLFTGEAFKNGLFEVQDEGSQLIAMIMNPGEGETVWDMCAGAGGKSLALAAIMKNKGRVLATDIRQNKIMDLKKRAKRAGAFNIFPADMERLDETKFFKKGMNKVLIDAPCSGTGTLRRNPDAKWKLREEQFAEYREIQTKLIKQAADAAVANGLLFYVTCSVEKAENEDVIDAVRRENPNLVPVPVKEHFPSIKAELCSGPYLRLWPDKHGMDGFFMAILRKNADKT